MSKSKLTQAHIDFIRSNHAIMPGREIARRLGVGSWVVAKYQQKHNLKTPKAVFVKFRVDKATGKTSSNPGTDAYLIEHYLTVSLKRMSAEIGRSSTFVRIRMRQLGLVVPQEIIEQRKSESRIQKGSEPPNKGKKMDAETYNKVKRTFFSKDHIPHNTKYDGAIRISQKEGDRPYKLVRVRMREWKLLHRHIWEQVNGEIPEGYLVTFRDGNAENCSIDNLQLMSKQENMVRNSYHNYAPELVDLIHTRAVLTRIINKQSKIINNAI